MPVKKSQTRKPKLVKKVFKSNPSVQPKEGWTILSKNANNQTIFTPPYVSSVLELDRNKLQHLIWQCKQQYANADAVPQNIVHAICNATQRCSKRQFEHLDLHKEVHLWRKKVFELSEEGEYASLEDVEYPLFCWVMPHHSPKFFMTNVDSRKHVLKVAIKNKSNWLLSPNPFSGGYVFPVNIERSEIDPLIASMSASWAKYAAQYEMLNGVGSYDDLYGFVPVYEETDDENEEDEPSDESDSDVSTSDK